MQRRILTLLAVAALAVGLAACGSSSKANNSSPTGNTSATGNSSAPSSTSDSITISGFKFSAATVKAGSTVTVNNKDNTAHTVKSDNGKFDTGAIDGGTSKTFTAPSTPGTYSFHCGIHNFMTGTLTVTA